MLLCSARSMIWFALLLFTVLIPGCGTSLNTIEVTRLKDLDAQTRKLLDEFLDSLIQKDWATLHSLHWSGADHTTESLRNTFEPMLARIGLPNSIVDQLEFLKMTADDYENYLDEDELPGPSDLLWGRIEFNVAGSDPNNFILVYAYLCEIDDAIKIFEYIDYAVVQ